MIFCVPEGEMTFKIFFPSSNRIYSLRHQLVMLAMYTECMQTIYSKKYQGVFCGELYENRK